MASATVYGLLLGSFKKLLLVHCKIALAPIFLMLSWTRRLITDESAEECRYSISLAYTCIFLVSFVV